MNCEHDFSTIIYMYTQEWSARGGEGVSNKEIASIKWA